MSSGIENNSNSNINSKGSIATSGSSRGKLRRTTSGSSGSGSSGSMRGGGGGGGNKNFINLSNSTISTNNKNNNSNKRSSKSSSYHIPLILSMCIILAFLNTMIAHVKDISTATIRSLEGIGTGVGVSTNSYDFIAAITGGGATTNGGGECSKALYRRIYGKKISSSLSNQTDVGGVDGGIETTTSTSRRLQQQQQQLDEQDHQEEIASPAKYAYAYVLVGCDPSHPSYLGFLYNILISTHILHTTGSTADVVVFIRMAWYSQHKKIHIKHMKWLSMLGCKVIYLRKPKYENFMEAQMSKFRILDLVQYKRVLYMDADTLPLCNLDWIFHLSDNEQKGLPSIMENMILAWTKEPAMGSFFMLEPGQGEFHRLQRVIENQKDRARNLPYPHFDRVQGWGHVFDTKKNETWMGLNGKLSGDRWSWYAAYNDQGILYYWARFVKKRVTIVTGIKVQNWSEEGMEEEQELPFRNHTCRPKPGAYMTDPSYENLASQQPYSDFLHFNGKVKPWEGDIQPPIKKKKEATSSRQYWFYLLRQLDAMLCMGIDFDNWSTFSSSFRKPPLTDRKVPTIRELKERFKTKLSIEV